MIFNNGTHAWIADRELRAEHSIILKHGEKMLFGKNNDKGLALQVNVQRDDVQCTKDTPLISLVIVPADDPRVLVHDAHQQDPTLHRLLALMGQERNLEVPSDQVPSNKEELPIALGVIRDVEAETYDKAVNEQIQKVRTSSKAHTFDELTATLEQWS